MRTELKKARKSKGRKQREVAEYLGIATNHYQNIEYGKSDTSGDNWIRIHEYLDKIYPLEDMMKNSPKL